MVHVTNTLGMNYVEALILKYKAEISEAEAVLNTYFSSTVGIGEHSDILVEFDKWVGKIADAKGKLEVVEKFTTTLLQQS